MDNLADVHGAEDDDEEFRPPLPMEDRLWRHPSEMGAAAAVAAPAGEPVVSIFRTPWRQGLALASIGAIGGALVVAGLFLTLGGAAPVPTEPAPNTITTVALPAISPLQRTVDADRWPAEVVTRAQPGVARIAVERDDSIVVGSGVVFRSDGLLMTSHDLVAGGGAVTVSLADGTNHPGQVLGVDSISGLAVVLVDHHDLPTAPLAIVMPAPEVGDYTVALGGLAAVDGLSLVRLSATAVDVAIDNSQRLHGLLQLDGGAPAGSSGGGVIDDAGAVIGIIVDVGTDNATYAVPIGYARKIAEDILRYGEAKHAWLGIKGVDHTPEPSDSAAWSSASDAAAVRIASVIEGSPAARSSLQKGDLIVGIDGKEVVSMTELVLELRNHPPGDDIEIRFLRDDIAFRVTVELVVRQVGDTT